MTSAASADSLAQLRERLRQFAAERDWAQFHNPKNLAASVAIEAACEKMVINARKYPAVRSL